MDEENLVFMFLDTLSAPSLLHSFPFSFYAPFSLPLSFFRSYIHFF